MTAVTERVARTDRFGLRDLLAEAAAGIGARPGRLLLTILGTVLGIASVVVTVGLAQTASGQINKQFDAVAATQAVAEPETSSGWDGSERAIGTLPWDAPARAERLAGVEAAGTFSTVDVGDAEITAVPVHDPSAARTAAPDVSRPRPGRSTPSAAGSCRAATSTPGTTPARTAWSCSGWTPRGGSAWSGWTASRRSSSATAPTRSSASSTTWCGAPTSWAAC